LEFHFKLPVGAEDIKKLNVGDTIYISGKIFTARDEAHHKLLETDKNNLPFDPSEMALYHCGPLMKKTNKGWQVVSAGPTTYTAYTGGAGALAAEKVKEVPAVYWLEELGMPEAVWIFEVNEFGPLVVAIDSHGRSLYKK